MHDLLQLRSGVRRNSGRFFVDWGAKVFVIKISKVVFWSAHSNVLRDLRSGFLLLHRHFYVYFSNSWVCQVFLGVQWKGCLYFWRDGVPLEADDVGAAKYLYPHSLDGVSDIIYIDAVCDVPMFWRSIEDMVPGNVRSPMGVLNYTRKESNACSVVFISRPVEYKIMEGFNFISIHM